VHRLSAVGTSGLSGGENHPTGMAVGNATTPWVPQAVPHIGRATQHINGAPPDRVWHAQSASLGVRGTGAAADAERGDVARDSPTPFVPQGVPPDRTAPERAVPHTNGPAPVWHGLLVGREERPAARKVRALSGRSTPSPERTGWQIPPGQAWSALQARLTSKPCHTSRATPARHTHRATPVRFARPPKAGAPRRGRLP
jgi:hypothetical protein